MKKTLLDIARSLPPKKEKDITNEEYEVFLACAKDEVTPSQVLKALNISQSNFYVKSFYAFKRSVKNK